jgi:anthranilate/para-aminobenzoate synthase component II
LGELRVDLLVRRNDEISIEQIRAFKPERILVSPGPCLPRTA